MDGRLALKPGDLIVLDPKEAGENVPLTSRPGNAHDDTDNVLVVDMLARDIGIILAVVRGGMGTEFMVLTQGTYGWNMAKYFMRAR